LLSDTSMSQIIALTLEVLSCVRLWLAFSSYCASGTQPLANAQ
jgi:hypothetical protein